MNSLMVRLWNDDAGYLLSAESVFLFTIVVLGLLTGWVAIRNSVVSELTEVANTVASLNQTYAYSGLLNCAGNTVGSSGSDSYLGLGFTPTAPIAATLNVNPCSGGPTP